MKTKKVPKPRVPLRYVGNVCFGVQAKLVSQIWKSSFQDAKNVLNFTRVLHKAKLFFFFIRVYG